MLELIKALVDESWDDAFTAAHALKGLAWNMGFISLMYSVGKLIVMIEAVELFENAAPDTYIAILMDVHMTVMSGHEAARAIRSSAHPEAKTIPIIAMTADAFAENVAEAYESGMNSNVSKPIDIQTLHNTLKRYVN